MTTILPTYYPPSDILPRNVITGIFFLCNGFRNFAYINKEYTPCIHAKKK